MKQEVKADDHDVKDGRENLSPIHMAARAPQTAFLSIFSAL